MYKKFEKSIEIRKNWYKMDIITLEELIKYKMELFITLGNMYKFDLISNNQYEECFELVSSFGRYIVEEKARTNYKAE